MNWLEKKQYAMTLGYYETFSKVTFKNSVDKFWIRCDVYDPNGRWLAGFKCHKYDFTKKQMSDKVWKNISSLLPERRKECTGQFMFYWD